ncbi:MAG: fibronectin type III domain-containing protein [Balneolaceae bacterium]|nr:fibronectin type III domain-containing protein [Balneolaceae bacterium]
MNKFTALRNLLLVAWFIHLTSFGVLAQIGIGLPAGEEPQSSLDVRFDSAISPGFLMPRVTSLPTGDIAEGMLIYYCSGCTDTDGDGQVNYENGSYYVYVDNDGNGTSEWTELASNAGVVEVDNTSPTAPTNLAASNPSTTTIDLSWTVSTDNVGVAGYFIYLNDGTLVTTAPSNSITVSGLEANTSYTFYVTAYDASMNESSSSNNATESTTSIPDSEAPSAPSSLVASNITTSSVDLSWGASTDNVGVTGYYVYQDGVQVSDVTSGTSTTISSLSQSTQYSFYVTAYDAAGNESSQSNTVTPTTDSPCVSGTICETSFEGTNGCWTLFANSNSEISNTSPDCSYSAYNGSNVIEIIRNGEIETSTSNDFTGNTSVDVSFWHTGYYKQNRNSCSGAISNTIFLEVSTNGISWTVIESYSSSSTWQQATGTIDGVYMTSGIYVRIRVNGDSSKNYTLLDSTRIDVNCD